MAHKHTPGNWRVGKNYPCRIIANEQPIAFACDPQDEGTETEEELANARLISAAPELLIACKCALNDRMYKYWPEIADILIKAIAKAEEK